LAVVSFGYHPACTALICSTGKRGAECVELEKVIQPYPEGNLKGLYPKIDIRP